MKKINELEMEEFGRLEGVGRKRSPVLEDRWWPQTAKKDEDRINKTVPT